MNPPHGAQVARYRTFIRDRDAALERIHFNAQLATSDTLAQFLGWVLLHIGNAYPDLEKMPARSSRRYRHLRDSLELMARSAALNMTQTIQRLRANSYVLSRVGETEALARAAVRPMQYTVRPEDVSRETSRPANAGGDLEARVELYLSRIVSKALDKLSVQLLVGMPRDAALKRIASGFPTRTLQKRPSNTLKDIKAREASSDDPFGRDFVPKDPGSIDDPLKEPEPLTTGFVSDQEWDDMVDAYKDEFVPTGRDPLTVVGLKPDDLGGEGQPMYGWELEQDVTDEFVTSVREGQVAAAKEQGIMDFIWIAVLDNRTDECCAWRDGLTSSEIQTALKEGDHAGDECRALVPPAHFNCRCTISPALDNVPDQGSPDTQSFEEWLIQ